MADKTPLILSAAGTLFAKHGLRGTSMEAIARSAQIAKPTLYAYFADKEAVFQAVVDQQVEEWRQAFLHGLRGDGDVAIRIGAALTNMNKLAMRLRSGSPHADDLYSEEDRLVGPAIVRFEAEVAGAVEHELMLAGAARPRLVAQVLLASAAGLMRKAQSASELGPAIRLLTERLVGPELPR